MHYLVFFFNCTCILYSNVIWKHQDPSPIAEKKSRYIIIVKVLIYTVDGMQFARWFNMNKIINKQGSPHLQKIGRLDFSLWEHEFAVILLSQQVKPSYCLNKALFYHSYVFSHWLQLLCRIALQIICEKGATCKKKQGDFNFALRSREDDLS